jgi:hypothetical protein
MRFANATQLFENRWLLARDRGFDRPVYEPLKRLMHIFDVGFQQRGAVICSDGQ